MAQLRLEYTINTDRNIFAHIAPFAALVPLDKEAALIEIMYTRLEAGTPVFVRVYDFPMFVQREVLAGTGTYNRPWSRRSFQVPSRTSMTL